MQLFQTDRGAARRRAPDGTLELIDVPDLPAAIAAGGIDDVLTAGSTETVGLDEVELACPVRPGRLFQVGLNYRSHLAEIGRPAPEAPMFGVAPVADTLNAPGGAIVLPADNPDMVDHECEIAIVIGRHAHNVGAEHAWTVIAGLTAINDVSARDVQRAGLATGDLGAGKMLPGFKPLGSGILTSDEAAPLVADGSLTISLTVNENEYQRSAVSDMVFSIPELVEIISDQHELHAGDVIMTGSPAGVGVFAGRFLTPGDVVAVQLADLPPLVNTIAAA